MSRKLYDNTETLEEVLELLNNKAAGGGGTDTSDATATSADILIDKTAYANGEKITGSIPLQSAKTITPSASEQVAISSGYYASGDVKVQGDANLTAENIKKGATIFGVEGNYEGEGGGVENKLLGLIDGTTTELTAEDLAGATSIRDYGFYRAKSLISIVIPESVTSIGDSAFYNCTKLTSVVIPNSVIFIGQYAFYGAGLTSIEIPDSVTVIKQYTFWQTNLVNAVIGNGVTLIDDYAFASCWSLASVVIGESVETIDSRAFHACSSLTSINIPKSVKSIGNYVFQNCKVLKQVDFSNHTAVPTLGSSVFDGTSADLQIIVPSNLLDEWKAATNWSNYADKIVAAPPKPTEGLAYSLSSDGTYATCTGIGTATDTDIVIASEYEGTPITSIGNTAFNSNTSITSVIIPDSVTFIGQRAFSYCSSLTNIELPNSINSLSDSVLSGCAFTNIVIPSAVTFIGYAALNNCKNLKRVDFSNHTSIPQLYSGDIYSKPFGNTHADLQIKVPASLYEEWKNATNWADYADKIVTEFTNTL